MSLLDGILPGNYLDPLGFTTKTLVPSYWIR